MSGPLPLKSFQLAVTAMSQMPPPAAQTNGMPPDPAVVTTKSSELWATSLLSLPAMPAGNAKAVAGNGPLVTPVYLTSGYTPTPIPPPARTMTLSVPRLVRLPFTSNGAVLALG